MIKNSCYYCNELYHLRLFIFHPFSAFYLILNQDVTRVRNKIDNLLKNYYVCQCVINHLPSLRFYSYF